MRVHNDYKLKSIFKKGEETLDIQLEVMDLMSFSRKKTKVFHESLEELIDSGKKCRDTLSKVKAEYEKGN